MSEIKQPYKVNKQILIDCDEVAGIYDYGKKFNEMCEMVLTLAAKLKVENPQLATIAQLKNMVARINNEKLLSILDREYNETNQDQTNKNA